MKGLAVPLVAAALLLPAAALALPAPALAAHVDPALAAAVRDGAAVAILVHAPGRTADAVALLDAMGVPHTDLERVGVSQAVLDARGLDRVRASGAVRAVYAESRLLIHAASPAESTHVVEARERYSVDGSGATVLVIDTGIDGLHPDLADRVVEVAQPFDPLEYGLTPDGYTTAAPANDAVGHGTHVAGIVAGTGAALGELDPQHGKVVGVAPGASLAVWSIPGLGTSDTVFQAVQGFEYALEKQDAFGIRVITNSWGVNGAFDPDHPVNVASLAAYRAGMAVVFAAGNEGTGAEGGTMLNPFCVAPWVLCVAASTPEGAVADYSSRGARAGAPPYDHPDLIAPGSNVLSTKSRTGALQATSPLDAPASPGDPVAQATFYQYMSGTSMATPHVAGVLALAISANPSLSPDEAYDAVVGTADAFPGEAFEVGAGLVNATGAVERALATAGSMDAFLDGERRYDSDPDFATDPFAVAFASRPAGTASSAPPPKESPAPPSEKAGAKPTAPAPADEPIGPLAEGEGSRPTPLGAVAALAAVALVALTRRRTGP